MKYHYPLILISTLGMGLLFLASCAREDMPIPPSDSELEIRCVDISSFPQINADGTSFFDENGLERPLKAILKNSGINTIRLRLWVNPGDGHSGFQEVKDFTHELKNAGFRIWLSVHYSDTWADPGQQLTPEAWRGLSLDVLKDSVYLYTEKVMTQIAPDYIQIGNEINNGLLHPQGSLSQNPDDFITLLNEGVRAVRNSNASSQIIVQYAGIQGASWFYNQISDLDYDIIGLSYYPLWHGKSLDSLEQTLSKLKIDFDKDVVIAETAYPFTLDWNDWTNNIVGLESQLILPEYPASRHGQAKYVSSLYRRVQKVNGIGLCYWAADWVAWKGQSATDASPWENQALFDFSHQELPALKSLSGKY